MSKDNRTKKDLILEIEMYKGVIDNISKKIIEYETIFFKCNWFNSIKSLLRERRKYKMTQDFYLFLMKRFNEEKKESKK